MSIKDYTGSVSVEGNITPITREKIESVEPQKWVEMDINMLYDQRIILNNRMVRAYQAGHAEIAQQIQNGINLIDSLIKKKVDEQNNKEGTQII